MPYCERCDRDFPSWHALTQHENNSPRHNVCDDCGFDFPTWTGLKEHYVQSPRHSYCQKCDEHFDDTYDLEEHYDEAHFWCRPCNKFFVNAFGLNEHYRQSPAHHYCVPCNRLFASASNLQSHLNSSTHRPRDVPCRGRGCTQTFVSVSAMLLHLEAGTCVSGFTRRLIDTKVRELDRNNIITDPSRMIAGPSSDNTTYYATTAAWNGAAWECYLCHGTYRSLPALNQHLASPRHQDKIYVCPGAQCRIRFTTLSALCQHIESERCDVHKFREVKLAMDGIHLNSSAHRSNDVPCRGKGCPKKFISLSAMLLHLEAGTCVSGFTRPIIDKTIHELDRLQLITNPSHLLTSSTNNTTYYATDAAWNGGAWECYFCHRLYRSLFDLNQHLGSPRHQNKIYVCPNPDMVGCGTSFTTLSALCQHIESGKCGVQRFREVRTAMDRLVGQMGQLGV
ncbi:hypothetical protein DXG01_002747 [Tephrocybe rancida]|nr:hypothetical protein DXG01_002747 [Tephrocybe rancida]